MRRNFFGAISRGEASEWEIGPLSLIEISNDKATRDDVPYTTQLVFNHSITRFFPPSPPPKRQS
jgi:hypothetical protein